MISMGTISWWESANQKCLAYLNCPVVTTECDALDNAGPMPLWLYLPRQRKIHGWIFLRVFQFLTMATMMIFARDKNLWGEFECCERDKSEGMEKISPTPKKSLTLMTRISSELIPIQVDCIKVSFLLSTEKRCQHLFHHIPTSSLCSPCLAHPVF